MQTPLSVSADPRLAAWRALAAAYAHVREAVESDLAAAGFPEPAWYEVLWELESAELGKLRMHELASAVFLSRSNITRLTDRMVREGLLARVNCMLDRRVVWASVTKTGRAMRKKMSPVYQESIRRHFASKLAPAQQKQLVATLGKVIPATQKDTKRGVRNGIR